MKDSWNQTKVKPKKQKRNIKAIVIVSILSIIIGLLIATIILYLNNEDAKNWIDKNILGKEIEQANAVSIEIDDENAKICAFNQNIGILSKNSFNIYDSNGKQEKTLNIEVTTPVFDTENKFLTIAEDGGQKAYLISDKDILWEKNIEGNISQIHVNNNGYVAIVVTNTSYKTVIEMYSPKGEELFKTYLSTTRVSDATISNDNKYLAIAEIDTSGTMIQSSTKIISIEKAKSDPTNSIEKIYNAQSNKLLTKIKYQDNNRLVNMFTDSITEIEDGEENQVIDNSNKKVSFASVDLSNNVVTLEEKSSGLFTADSVLNITNTTTKETKEYTADEVSKEIYTKGDIIALNLGSEIDFINTNGWLVKKYLANQEVSSLALSNSIAGIVYRDKVEIIKF